MTKPVVLVVMDGVGETPSELGNMVKQATTPTLDEMKANDGSDWCYVFWSGKYGFCAKKYLKETVLS